MLVLQLLYGGGSAADMKKTRQRGLVLYNNLHCREGEILGGRTQWIDKRKFAFLGKNQQRIICEEGIHGGRRKGDWGPTGGHGKLSGR